MMLLYVFMHFDKRVLHCSSQWLNAVRTRLEQVNGIAWVQLPRFAE